MSDKMRVREGDDGYSYPYTSPDIVIDENEKSVSTKFNEVNAQFKDMATNKADKNLINLIYSNRKETVEGKFVTKDGNIITSSATPCRYITVPIKANMPIYVHADGTYNGKYLRVKKDTIGCIQVLGEDYAVIQTINDTYDDTRNAHIDDCGSNAKYLRINTAFSGSEYIGNLYVGYLPYKEEYLNDINLGLNDIYDEFLDFKKVMETQIGNQNRLYGKKIVAIGDSMVAGNGVATEDLWLTKMAKRNNMTYVNYGINGSFLSRKEGLVDKCAGVCDRTASMDADADYIIVYAGTNDAANSIAMGDESSTSKEEFMGALVQTCKQLLTKYPTGKIMFITPYRKYSTFLPYIEAIENICGKYGIPVFNNYKNGGICWQISAQTNLLTQGDNTHLNATGHEFVSYKFEEALRRL